MRPDRLRGSDSRALAREARSRRALQSLEDQITIVASSYEPQKQPARPAPVAPQHGIDARPGKPEGRENSLVCLSGPNPEDGNLIRFVEDFHGAGRQGN